MLKNTKFVFKTITAVIGMIIVIGAIAVVTKSVGRYEFGKTSCEKLFAMSWKEFSELSDEEFVGLLQEEQILYEETAGGLKTKSVDTFMGSDCLFEYDGITKGALYDGYSGNKIQSAVFSIAFEGDDSNNDGKRSIENYLKKNVLKCSDVFMEHQGDHIRYLYLAEVSDQNIDKFLEHKDKALWEKHFAERNIKPEDCSIYKFVTLKYVKEDEAEGFRFPSEKTYVDDRCQIGVEYWLMEPEEYINMAASYGYDAIEDKPIDIDAFKAALDEEIVGAIVRGSKEDNLEDREETEKQRYILTYMIEQHNFDRKRMKYLKTEEEKKLWYIWYYQWDIDTKSFLDLSQYDDSPEIYCAVVYRYNIETAEYFENDLDRALYLVDKDYNIETGKSFVNSQEKCLWFMKNYAYDIVSGNTVDHELVEALIAYQEYIDGIPDAETAWQGYNLIYLDEDEIPELVATGTCEAAGHMLLTWQNGVIQEAQLARLGGLRYAEKKNFYCNANGHMGSYFVFYYKLENGRQITIAEGNMEDKRDENGTYIMDEETGYFEQEFFWNGTACSEEELENERRAIEAEAGIGASDWKEVPEEQYSNVMSAYQALQ